MTNDDTTTLLRNYSIATLRHEDAVRFVAAAEDCMRAFCAVSPAEMPAAKERMLDALNRLWACHQLSCLLGVPPTVVEANQCETP